MNTIEFAVAETLKAHPYLTRDDAVYLLTDYIGAVPPQLVKDVQLPDVHIVKRIEEAKLKRSRRAYRETKAKEATKKLQFIDALYKLKELSNGNGKASPATEPIAYETIASTTIAIPIPIPSETYLEKISNRKYQDKIIDIRFPFEVAPKEPEFFKGLESTVLKESVEVLRFERIIEDVEILRKKNRDDHFGIIIEEVKSIIENMPALQDEDYSAEIRLLHDVELPDWEQTIIKFKIENKNFDEKMVLWDEVDSQLRKVIKDKAVKKGISPLRIDEINRNLFVDIELA